MYMDKFASYVIFFLIIKLKKKNFEFHLNYFFLFIVSSSQPNYVYTQFFGVSLFLLRTLQLFAIFFLSPLYHTYNLAGNFFFFHQIEYILCICCLFIIYNMILVFLLYIFFTTFSVFFRSQYSKQYICTF